MCWKGLATAGTTVHHPPVSRTLPHWQRSSAAPYLTTISPFCAVMMAARCGIAMCGTFISGERAIFRNGLPPMALPLTRFLARSRLEATEPANAWRWTSALSTAMRIILSAPLTSSVSAGMKRCQSLPTFGAFYCCGARCSKASHPCVTACVRRIMPTTPSSSGNAKRTDRSDQSSIISSGAGASSTHQDAHRFPRSAPLRGPAVQPASNPRSTFATPRPLSVTFVTRA